MEISTNRIDIAQLAHPDPAVNSQPISAPTSAPPTQQSIIEHTPQAHREADRKVANRAATQGLLAATSYGLGASAVVLGFIHAMASMGLGDVGTLAGGVAAFVIGNGTAMAAGEFVGRCEDALSDVANSATKTFNDATTRLMVSTGLLATGAGIGITAASFGSADPNAVAAGALVGIAAWFTVNVPAWLALRKDVRIATR